MQRVTVLDVADDERQFQGYLNWLFKQGVWEAKEDWLVDRARSLMDVEYSRPQGVARVSAGWTIERRRVLVAITWPTRFGIPTLLEAPETALVPRSSPSALMPRTYDDIWSNVRDNIKSMVQLAQRRGYTAGSGNAFLDAARLGLLTDDAGGAVNFHEADAMMADAVYRTWHSGFLLTAWDLVNAVQGMNVSFTPTDDQPDGAYILDLETLVARLRRARWVSAAREKIPALIEDEIRKLRDFEGGPAGQHHRLTANGLILPPAPGSKYRRLFERLDEWAPSQGEFVVSRADIDGLVLRVRTERPRRLRGSRGAPALPSGAITSRRWWQRYASWDADQPHSPLDAERLKAEVANKPHKRAWLAAGMRAVPRMGSGGELRSVAFEGMRDRRDWWTWRQQLREGSFQSLVEATPQDE